jgi:predicted TIM-barrel fold metal-dependent hydrolase
MVIDCHVHVCAFTQGHGSVSPELSDTIPFRIMRWKLGLDGEDWHTEDALADLLAHQIEDVPELDAAVVLAFDAVHDTSGAIDGDRTHLYVTNDYVIELCRKYPRMLFGASVHPYRKDALAELERCIANGAVLLKWLPIVQDFDPSDRRCIPIYEAMAHHGLPLLSHTGGERSLPNLNKDMADPMLLLSAVERGVTVIAAHCGTRSAFGEHDYLPTWARMAREHEHFYGDTSALNLPTRSYAWKTLLNDTVLRSKLIHGSDWPIPPIPPMRIRWGNVMDTLSEENWLARDVRIKQLLGLEAAYFNRGGQVLRVRELAVR